MRFGVNYIPSENWLFCWMDFDEDSVRNDLLAIKKLGFDHIRAHLLWSFFQLNEQQMCQHCMKNLEKFVKLCEETQLQFFLSLFTGWMSGYSFFPAWLGRNEDFSMFLGEREKRAEKFYIREIASVVAESPAFLGFDLGNELSWICKLDSHTSLEANDCWSKEMFDACEKFAPGKMHHNGVDHLPWFWERGFSRENLANDGKITCLHSWTLFTGALERSGLLGTESVNVASYMAELARAYSHDSHRPLWIQEIGCSPLWLGSEGDSIEEFIDRTMEGLSDCENLWGITWWCSHDISKRFTDFPDLEYELGIFTSDNQPKPYARKLSEMIKKYTNRKAVPKPKTVALLYRPEIEDDTGWKNAERYMRLIEKGERPCIILPQYLNDDAYIVSREIKKIITD